MCMYYSDSFDTDDDNNIHVCGVVQNGIADAIDKVSSKQCIGLRNFMPHLSNYDFTHVNQNLLTSL